MTEGGVKELWRDQIELADKLDKLIDEMFTDEAASAEKEIRELMWDDKIGIIRGLQSLRQAAARIAELEAHVQQLQAKLHCMCGSPIDHSSWEGHSPVSMYDYALDKANERIDELERALGEMRSRDDRNGSLPTAYREIIDAALATLRSIVEGRRREIAAGWKPIDNAIGECRAAVIQCYYGSPSSRGGRNPDNWHLPEDCTPTDAAMHDNGINDAVMAIGRVRDRLRAAHLANPTAGEG